MTFDNFITYQAGLQFHYSDTLDNSRLKIIMFSTTENNKNLFTKWSFPDKIVWDDFWFNDTT